LLQFQRQGVSSTLLLFLHPFNGIVPFDCSPAQLSQGSIIACILKQYKNTMNVEQKIRVMSRKESTKSRSNEILVAGKDYLTGRMTSTWPGC
jgi:hypothetical protein